jgi:exopolysaccharide biosynthesis protein
MTPVAAHTVPRQVVAAASDARLETARTSRPVAPGVSLTSVDTVDANGWLRADVLTTDLGGGVKVDYLNPGAVAADEPVRGPATRTHAVAAINGDFFDINNSGAAEGVGVQGGQLIQSPTSGHNNAVGFSAEGLGRILQVSFEGTASWAGGSVSLTQFNNRVATGGVGLFTPLWGSYPRQRAVDGATNVVEVVLTGATVSQVGAGAGQGVIPAGTTVLLGREAGADALRALKVGDQVDVAYRPKASDGGGLHTAVGGNQVLVTDGVAQQFTDTALAARSAVGFSRDGRKMYLLTVDGKQVNSAGVTLTQWAGMVAGFGAYSALNIDGGGSSTLLARKPGEIGLTLENSPSDGSERAVANGIGLYAPAGSGSLKGFWVAPAADVSAAPGADQVRLARPDRVFGGLTRRLVAKGYDETYAPAAGTPQWRTSPPGHGWVNGDGVFHALAPGTVTVVASRNRASGQTALTVLGPLARIAPTNARLGLPDPNQAATFGIVGYDAAGAVAPIEPDDAKLDYDHELFDVATSANGNFAVRAKQPVGAGVITVHVGTSVTAVAVTVGLTEVPVATFDDAAQWTFSQARASGSLAVAEGHTGPGLKLHYDFTQSTATRAAYANPPTQFTVAGQPQAFGMWIYGNGHGEWPALEFYDGLGQSQILRGPFVTWTGWRYVEMAVPTGVAYPLKLRRFYVVETKAVAQYTGDVIVDDLVAKVPPSVEVPAVPTVVDPIVVRDATVGGRNWRFAVMSDAQFVARSPDSDIVANARRTLREVRAARPDFLIIDGDLVDEGSPADIAFAKKVLDEELGGTLPYYYVPGNHEVMGGPIGNFKAVFGDAHRVFDHNGTRFVTLDTSSLTIRGGGFDQYTMLRDALDTAAADPRIGSVVLVEHVPPRDPTPGKGSQLSDRKEAGLVEDWLADFQARTGKGAAFIGAHVGTFHASRVDDVPYVINGNSGKNPATPADQGGFTGWSLWGVNPVRHAVAGRGPADWIATQLNPHVDALAISAPATLRVGKAATVAATLTQPGGRLVPVAYPVSYDWSASPNVRIGSRWGAMPWQVAVFDPGTGELTALRTGSIWLSVTVNGVTQQVAISVTRT